MTSFWIAESTAPRPLNALRQRFIEQHRAPFDEILRDSDATAQLGDDDPTSRCCNS